MVRLDLCLGRMVGCNVRLIYNTQLSWMFPWKVSYNLFKYNLSPQFFLSRDCHYTSYLTWHIIPHMYTLILLIVHRFMKTKTGSPSRKANTRNIVEVTARVLPFRNRACRIRAVTQNSCSATETERNWEVTGTFRSVFTHEKTLLNGDVPRRNGNVTYSVNRPVISGSWQWNMYLWQLI
jgi:hypothetical protein